MCFTSIQLFWISVCSHLEHGSMNELSVFPHQLAFALNWSVHATSKLQFFYFQLICSPCNYCLGLIKLELFLCAYQVSELLISWFAVLLIREHTYPRHIALVIAQILMAVGHFLFAMAWPGTMYIGTFLVGLGYGAHWAIVPAAVSELFGIKHFGAMYNFLALANPTGSLIFSGLITSTLYDYEAEK